jgi:PAS domain S-box-containing protein
MKTRSLMRWRTVGLLLAMLIIVGLPYIVTLQGSRDTEQATEWVARSTEVKSLAYRVAYVVHDSEAATYRLLAGDVNEATRARSQRVSQEVPPLLQQLRRMTRDNPDQQALMGSLASSVSGRVTLMNQALSRLRQGNPDGARQSLRDADDLFGMNAQIGGIVQIEDGLLKQRQAEATRQSFNGRVVLSITALAQILLLVIIVIASERQIGRRQLAETREGRAVMRSQLIFQAVREPIALFDENLNSLLVNNAFSELYGMETGQRSQPLVQIGEGAWSDSVLLQRLNDVLLRDRELWDYDMVQRTVDGVDRHVVINARRLQQHDGGMPALLLTVSDVTSRALTEQKVIELNHQLEGKVTQISDVNRELEAFSYSVSHDLRAPSGSSRKCRRCCSNCAE